MKLRQMLNIDHRAPWSGNAQRYRCPGWDGRVDWRIHGRGGQAAAPATASEPRRSQAMTQGISDPARVLEDILGEADALIRQRQKDRGLEFPHLVVAVTPDGQVVLRGNVSPDGLRSFSEDLGTVANELTAPPEPGDTTH